MPTDPTPRPFAEQRVEIEDQFSAHAHSNCSLCDALDVFRDACLAEIDRLLDEAEAAELQSRWSVAEHQKAIAALRASEQLPAHTYPSFQERIWWRAAREEIERLTETQIEQRVIGHGEGQRDTLADVNAGRVDDLIEPRLHPLREEIDRLQQENERLKETVAVFEPSARNWPTLLKKAEAAEAEVKRLTALTRIEPLHERMKTQHLAAIVERVKAVPTIQGIAGDFDDTWWVRKADLDRALSVAI